MDRTPSSWHNLKSKYGITIEDFKKLVADQGGKCAICGLHQGTYLYVDHDHSTGKIRELLCSHCNTGLGYFQDNPRHLFNAMQYLRKHAQLQQKEATPKAA